MKVILNRIPLLGFNLVRDPLDRLGENDDCGTKISKFQVEGITS